MRVAIRVDASQLIGTGHMVRCLTLAGQFAAQGAEIHVISRHVTDQLRTAIASRGYAISILPGASSHKRETWCPHASWLQAHWEEDATATKAVVEKYQCDVLVVDHYALDHRWESALRAAAGTVFAIDDLADRRHDCDYLLDQNFMHDYTARYDSFAAFWYLWAE
jgi:UDP-2,4-diacetamido-2,4,6-trideoxy-beta-L-altropyranose hydrolase